MPRTCSAEAGQVQAVRDPPCTLWSLKTLHKSTSGVSVISFMKEGFSCLSRKYVER